MDKNAPLLTKNIAGDQTESTNSYDDDPFPFSRWRTLGLRSWRSEASSFSCSSLCPFSQGDAEGLKRQVEKKGEQAAGSRAFTKKSLTTSRKRRDMKSQVCEGGAEATSPDSRTKSPFIWNTIRRKGKARRPHDIAQRTGTAGAENIPGSRKADWWHIRKKEWSLGESLRLSRDGT